MALQMRPRVGNQGRHRLMTVEMEEVRDFPCFVDTLIFQEFLNSKPSKYVDEMVYFIWDEFVVMLSESTIKRGLQGSWTKESFNDFIHIKVIPHCTLYPHPRSILVMDNTPIHHSDVC